MGEKLGGSASSPFTMIMGGGGAAGGPAGLAAPTPFMPYQTGPGIQQGQSSGQQPGPYGIVPPDQARSMAREQGDSSGGGKKGQMGGDPMSMISGILGGGGMGGAGGMGGLTDIVGGLGQGMLGGGGGIGALLSGGSAPPQGKK